MSQIDESVELSVGRTDWAQLFTEEREKLHQVLPEEAVIEHIGSTAVPGMVAKPVIDIMVGVPASLPGGTDLPPLSSLGYEPLGEAGVPGRLYFRKRGQEHFNVHLVVRGGDHWQNNLLLRDYLCRNPQEAQAYSHCKQAILEAGVSTLLSYSERKGPFVQRLLERARRATRSS